MKNFYLEIRVNGVTVDEAMIVTVTETNYTDPPSVKPGPSLADVHAAMLFISDLFPEGWQVTNGQVCACPVKQLT